MGVHQRMELKLKFVLYVLLSVPIPALSCNSAPGKPTISESYNSADNVYLAFAQSIETNTTRSQNGNRIIKQTVIFRVLETWKGNYKIGEELTFQTTLFDGSCGVGATNEPNWLEEEPKNGKSVQKANYPRISGVWLIYENGTSKHQLNNSGRTSPLEYGGAEDLQELYKLKQQKSCY